MIESWNCNAIFNSILNSLLIHFVSCRSFYFHSITFHFRCFYFKMSFFLIMPFFSLCRDSYVIGSCFSLHEQKANHITGFALSVLTNRLFDEKWHLFKCLFIS